MDTTMRLNGAKGVMLAADVGGDPADPCVLLLPGFGQTRSAWSRAAKALVAAGRYVVTVDLRGHGDSDWSPTRRYELADIIQDVVAILGQLPPKTAVVGASLGGLAALAAIGESAVPIASALVLIDAAPRMAKAGMDRNSALMTIDAGGFATVEDAAREVAEYLGGGVPVDTADVQRHLRRADDGRFRWHVDPAYEGFKVDAPSRMAAQTRFTAAAAALDIPTFFVRGESSTKVDQESVRAFQELVPHAEVADIAGVGDVIIGRPNDAFDAAILAFLERAVPRPGSPPQGGVEPRLLRAALGCFATGVTVITTSDTDGAPLGFTANSFTSVSLDPPLVLFCVKRESASVEALRKCGAFAVNVLHIGQQAISAKFASKTEDRFAGTEWDHWDARVPIIFDAIANFECAIRDIFDGGDHVVVIGLVKRVHFEASRDPLLFFQGGYRRIHVAREE
jgi:flavin reductase (DIM6/NTAB) family NADH-FMN oxidoreductase RutF/pimeloyl-ACP methyl ester carboxylesterase